MHPSPPPDVAAARVRRDLLLIIGLGLLLVATGIGLRHPWPADEPRFALIARDMVTSGNWLFPKAGGDLYADKPPLFFWLIAVFYVATGSLRVSFLLPSLLAGLGTLLLVYDLGRRLWNREAGLWAALILLFTVQFTLQARSAQIDATLCFWVTLSLYAFLRHLLLRDGWGWYALGGFAAGLGVITKGVGFLPFLVFLPYAWARWRKWPVRAVSGNAARWSWAPLAFFAAIALWLVPMLIAVAMSGDPALRAYRDEILFHQTVTRYAAAWHHQQPFYYYLTVILPMWLPFVLLFPWLVPRWARQFRERDVRILLLLGWAVLVLLFFSASPGKRGLYILPALPAVALASGEWLRGLWQRPDVQRLGSVFALLLIAAAAGAFVYLQWIAPERAAELRDDSGLRYIAPLAIYAVAAGIAWLASGVGRGVVASAWALGLLWIVGSYAIIPQMDATRSARSFVAQLERLADPARELGLMAYKEQFLLNLERPSVNFGHSRWREGPAESYDAARWLNGAPGRQLLVPGSQLSPCFAPAANKKQVAEASRELWYLIDGPADSGCASQGHDERVVIYRPIYR
ncbi:MAG TPA: glycosyltransferase family 39 protein [Steroidobacteraceae bacterium]|nr:glycosyltransferase family 39 protein [Steroidobacteraceae bacterium]